VLVDNAQLAFNTAGLPEVASTAVTLPAPAPTPTVPIVTSVTVTPAVISVRKGNTQSFSATVAGTNSPSQTVTWSVYGDTSANTVIDINGLLTVAADETVNTLTVKATSTVDSTKSGTATVTVQAPLPTYTVTFKDWDEIVLKTQTVDEGGAATAPSNPTRVGYAFTSWDNAFNNVTSNLTVTAQYIKNRYTVTPAVDVSYTAGTTSDGITTMTVKNGVTGFKYFTVNISVEQSHSGNETVVFVHLRNGEQLAINATRADFDVVNTAAAAFNVNPGDIIKVYIVDDLSNDSSLNPTLLQ
jgi:Bacterial Ig-like domain (group 2).